MLTVREHGLVGEALTVLRMLDASQRIRRVDRAVVCRSGHPCVMCWRDFKWIPARLPLSAVADRERLWLVIEHMREVSLTFVS